MGAKAKAKTIQRIATYRGVKISLAMKKIAAQFSSFTKATAKQVTASNKFSSMIKIATLARRHMAHSALHIKKTLKATADSAQKTTTGAFAGKEMFEMLQEAVKVSAKPKKKTRKKGVSHKFAKYLATEKSSKAEEQKRILMKRKAHMRRMELAAAVIAKKFITFGKVFSAGVRGKIKRVLKAKKLLHMRKISMSIASDMKQMSKAIVAAAQASVRTQLAKARSIVAVRRKKTKINKRHFADRKVDPWDRQKPKKKATKVAKINKTASKAMKKFKKSVIKKIKKEKKAVQKGKVSKRKAINKILK